MRSEQPTSKNAPGLIQNGTLYNRNEIKSRMGWKDSAFRQACRNGLKTHQRGKCVYVLGEDVIAYVTGKGESKSETKSQFTYCAK